MVEIALAVLVLTVVVVAAYVVTYVRPRLRSAQERQRISDEVRFARWQLQQAAMSAMQQMLDEARRARQ